MFNDRPRPAVFGERTAFERAVLVGELEVMYSMYSLAPVRYTMIW